MPANPRDRIDTSLPNRHMVLIGASGSGKSSYLRKLPEIQKARRVLAWDPDADHRLVHVHSVAGLHAACRKAGFGPIRVGLTVPPSMDAFGKFCGVAFAMAHGAAPLVVLVEELADVTTPAKAAPEWGELARRGRKYGAIIAATSQRPQEIDKTILGQADTIWCGRLKTEKDARYMAGIMGVDAKALMQLKPLEYFIKRGCEPAEQGRVRF